MVFLHWSGFQCFSLILLTPAWLPAYWIFCPQPFSLTPAMFFSIDALKPLVFVPRCTPAWPRQPFLPQELYLLTRPFRQKSWKPLQGGWVERRIDGVQWESKGNQAEFNGNKWKSKGNFNDLNGKQWKSMESPRNSMETTGNQWKTMEIKRDLTEFHRKSMKKHRKSKEFKGNPTFLGYSSRDLFLTQHPKFEKILKIWTPGGPCFGPPKWTPKSLFFRVKR